MTKPFLRWLPLCIAIPLLLLSGTIASLANLYSYPAGKKPALPLEEAMEVCKTFLKKDEFKGFYVTGVSILGSEKQDSSGAWTFELHKEGDGTAMLLSITFPEDLCVVQRGEGDDTKEADDDPQPIRFFTRDGKEVEEKPDAEPAAVDPFAPAKKGE